MARRARGNDDATTAWLGKASRTDSTSWGPWRNVASIRRLLAAYHALIAACPANDLQFFDQLDEATLADRSQNLTAFPESREKLSCADDVETAMLKLALVLRMLDTLLAEQAEGAVLRPEDEWCVEEHDCYVVPVAHFGSNQDRARTGQSFSRRGLIKHRVIHRRVADVDVRLTIHRDFASAADRSVARSLTFGAAVFPKFRFKHQKLPKNRFLLEEVECESGIEVAITTQMTAFRQSGCDIVAWPELTIDEDAREHIASLLEPSADSKRNPNVVVAGSWHLRDKDKIYNESIVYDGRGEFILRYDKMRIFRYEGMHEAIEPGGSVEVLVWDDKVLAFAICKDFCDRAKALPIASLDVDLAIVPSMGELKTLESHAVAANDMKILFGARTFVVQQTVPLGKLADGYVMALPSEPIKEPVKGMESKGEFITFQLVR